MKRLIIISFFAALSLGGHSQANAVYQRGLSAEENLKAISKLGPYSAGAVGFDNRYEGVKGSTRMLDTLLASFLMVRGQDYYIQLLADLDIVNNLVVYQDPKSKKLLTIPVDIVSEIIINTDGKELLFRTTYGKIFEKEMKPQRFCQILKDGQYQFIKIPLKKFVEADYKGAYSADRRYDEFQATQKYYLISSDFVFHQIQLNKKSVSKLYPEKKALIDQSDEEETFLNKEDMIISILTKF
jgi:hypothetical protein